MPATKDGRCWPCVQRRRWYSEEVEPAEAGGLLHLALEGRPLCELPRRERHREPENVLAYNRRYAARRRAANPEGYAWWARQRSYASELRRRYGITWPEWEALYVAQGGRCACCWAATATDVDHDHASGRVRGLLCSACNLMLGHAADSLRRLRAGAEYLGRFA